MPARPTIPAVLAIAAAVALAACGPSDDTADPPAAAQTAPTGDATTSAAPSDATPSATASPEPAPRESPSEVDLDTELTPGEPFTMQVGWAAFIGGVRIVLLSASAPEGDCDGCPLQVSVDLDDGSASETLELTEEERTGTAFGWAVRVEGAADGEAELTVTPAS